jgi:hypothetical protein
VDNECEKNLKRRSLMPENGVPNKTQKRSADAFGTTKRKLNKTGYTWFQGLL